jgi:hypothetical protein
MWKETDKKWKETYEMWKETDKTNCSHSESCKAIQHCSKWRELSEGVKDGRRTACFQVVDPVLFSKHSLFSTTEVSFYIATLR